ncbi:sensor histidine kinase [Brevundimonas sp. SL161]|uniref:sensor histidine kinase n=1 Tax=Brevundimonas sp. SL161 TaxID=2804613 RepID=UPI003CF2AB9B
MTIELEAPGQAGIEAERLRVLRSYDILDTDPEHAFDDVTRLAVRICETPVALVSLALGERLWFKARIGMADETGPELDSFCQHAMQHDGVYVVRDASIDPVYIDHPLVTGPANYRFYAGAPLIDDQGMTLGMLCVVDTKARPDGLTETQHMTLEVLATQVMALMERRRALTARRLSDEQTEAAVEVALQASEKLAESEARFQAIADSMPQMVWSAGADGYHDYFNARWFDFTGQTATPSDTDAWSAQIHPECRDRALAAWQASLATGEPYEVEYRLKHHADGYRWTLGRAMPIRNSAGTVTRWFGTGTDIEDIKRLEQAKALLSQELSHRIKNIFAVISALLSLSARHHPDAKDFARSARNRIGALARAHEFVRPHSEESRPGIAGTTLAAFLLDLFKAYDGEDGVPRVHVTGDDTIFDDQAATPVALLFHELATNAAKYGALSQPDGRVDLTLSHRGDRMILVWAEHGGPELDGPPLIPGFGSTLLAMSVEGQLAGRLDLDWAGEGLKVTVDVPRSALQPRRAAMAVA